MVAARRASRRRYVLVIIVLTALTLITLDTRHGRTGVVGALGRAAHTVVGPVERAVDSVTSPISDWWHGLVSASHLRSENRGLKEQISQLQGKEHNADIAIAEDGELKRILGLLNILQVKSVTGTVVNSDLGNFDSTLEIDRGTESGIRKNMTAIAPDGLVGQVIDAWHGGAKIRVLTDPLFKVGITTLGGHGALPAEALASGQQPPSTDLTATFQAPATVHVGDLVKTAPTSVMFPPGVPVGRISNITTEPGGLDATITPFVDIGSLQHVTVLLWVYGQTPVVYSTTTTSTTTTTTTTTVPGATTTTVFGATTTTIAGNTTTSVGHG